MIKIKKQIYKIGIYILFVYLLFGIFIFSMQRNIIYQPTSQDFFSCEGFKDFQAITFKETRIYFWDAGSDSALIFYHGNYGSACDRSFLKYLFKDSRRDIIFVEYAGYSDDVRRPTKDLLLQDAKNIAIFSENYSNVVVIGSSLGSAIASYQAKISEVDKLVLISPFSSVFDLAKEMYPLYPFKFLVRDNYDNIKSLKEYENEVIIFHGENDNMINHKLSKKLFNTIPSESKRYYLIPNSRHNDLWNSDLMVQKIKDFIEI